MKKITAFVLSVVMILSMIPFGVFAASGNGTETDPYQIATAADLIKMHEDLSAHYELVANIDMEGIDFEPIGNESEGSFTGSLDGKGHKISNLNLELPNNKFVGFIGCIEGGTVKNLNIENVSASGYRYVGGLVGYVGEGSCVENCSVNGTSSGIVQITDCYVAGIAGYNEGSISHCTNSASVSGKYRNGYNAYLSGIAAVNYGHVTMCENRGKIDEGCSGGIVGFNYKNVSECKNYGDGGNGGIAYDNNGTISLCNNYASMIGAGICVSNFGGVVTDCNNFGTIRGENWAAGIVHDQMSGASCIRCCNYGNIYSEKEASGICNSSSSDSVIAFCSNFGNAIVEGWYAKSAAGIVSETSGTHPTIKNCMSSGRVLCYSTYTARTTAFAYGLTYSSYYIENSSSYGPVKTETYNKTNEKSDYSVYSISKKDNKYILSETNQQLNHSLTYSEFKSAKTFSDFDFDNVWYIDENINSGFPTLRNMPRHIDLNECVLLMKPGETATLKAYIDGTPENVTYESENASIASVAADGTVKAIATGDIMISAKNAEGMRANCLVHITKDVSGISLNKSELSLESGKYETLSYTLNPQDANESVIWSSSDSEVASVNESGTVQANKIGSAVITVTTVTSGVQASCNVTVTGSPITDMYWYGSSINIYKNQPQKGNLQISPSNYSGVIAYSSSDETVATVADDGTITGHKVGSTVITATSDNGKTANLTVYVKVHTESILLDRSAITLNVGSTDKITPAVLPLDSTEPCYYSSSDSYYVSVSTDGTITAKNVTYNPVKITVSSGYKEAYCFVTVKQAAVLPTEISLDKTRLNMTKSEVVQLTASVLPDNATDTSVKWTTSNKDIASVSQTGTVTAVGEGVAVIRAETANGFYCECVVSVISASGFAVVLDDARALPGDTVQIKANIAKNPGISAYKFTIHYDSSKMLPTAIHPNRDFGGTFEDNLSEQTGDQFNVLWYSAQDTDVNGELFTVDFSVSDTALLSDSTPVTLTYNPTDICNTDGDFLSLYTKNASVFIKEPLPGDVFEDDEVNVYDLTLMARYITLLESFTKRQLIAADVNNDDVVDIKDVVKTAQYLVGWNGVELLSDSEKNHRADIVVSTAVSRNGATAEIPVEIQNNPGISGFRYEIAYDSDKVEILDIIPNTYLLGDNFGTNLGAQNGNPLVVTWYQNSDMTENGTLFTVTARLKDASAATISIVPANNNMCDRNTDEIIGNYTDGYLLSDRYIADIHADGETISVDAYFDDSFQAVPAVAIIALYDQNGKLCGTFWRDLESVASQQIVFDVGNVEYAACDFMIWQSFTTLKPIVEKTHFER